MYPYKTYYINTEDDGDIALPHASSMTFINTNFVTWCDILSYLSVPFMSAQFNSKFGIGPAKASVIIPEYYLNTKFKEDDAETHFERIDKLIQYMKPPSKGLILTVYAIKETDYEHFAWPFSTNLMWPLKVQNSPKDYISVQSIEDSKESKDTKPIVDELIREASNQNIEIKYVDYTQKTEDIIKTLQHSRVHISYQGASWWLAHYINTPLITPAKERTWTNFGKHNSSFNQPAGPLKPSILTHRDKWVNEYRPAENIIRRKKDAHEILRNSLSRL